MSEDTETARAEDDDIENITFSMTYDDDGEPDIETKGSMVADSAPIAAISKPISSTSDSAPDNEDGIAGSDNADDVDDETEVAVASASSSDDADENYEEGGDGNEESIREDEDSFSSASVLLRSYPAMSFDHVTLTNHKSGRNMLDNLRWTFEFGDLYALTGADDEQRRAFLQVASGFVRPDSGQVLLKSAGLIELDANEIRGHRIGLVTQQYSTWNELDALNNVKRTMESSGRTFLHPIPEIANRLLKTAGFDQAVSGIALSKVSEINRRRVAVARAISCDASVIIIDDPTGGLQNEDRTSLLNLLTSVAHDKDPKRCVIMLTNDETSMAAADAIVSFDD